MTDTTLTGNAIKEVADLAREATSKHQISTEVAATGLVVHVIRDDEQIRVVELEHTLGTPHAPRGTATLYDPDDFVDYVNRLADNHTTLWADPDKLRVTAVFDDHAQAEDPGWRRHRATLTLRPDPEWQAWTGHDKKLGGQAWFAEFIEDHLTVIVDPDPATMLEIATSFQARRNATFERGTRLQSGDVQLRWVEQTQATAGTKGHLEVPDRFTIKLAPYLGADPVDLVARLRYRINEGQLAIGYALHRPDLAHQDAFNQIRTLIDDGVSVPIHLGQAPASLHPTHL